MTEEGYDLSGKNVKIFMVGGWEFMGQVAYIDSEKIVVENGGELVVVYRDKIAAAQILPDKYFENLDESVSAVGYNHNTKDNPISYGTTSDIYSAVIPEDMLEGKPDENYVDLSMKMSDLRRGDV